METLTLLIFSSFPLEFISYFSLNSIYFNNSVNIYDDYVTIIRWQDNRIIYRNEKISSYIKLNDFRLIFGDFILVYGYGYLSGYASNSLSIRYFAYPKIYIDFYLSPSSFYQNMISKGFYIEKSIFDDSFYISFLYDSTKENYNFFIRYLFSKFSFLLGFIYNSDQNTINVGNFVFENKYKIYSAINYSFFNIIYLGLESSFYFLKDFYYYLNYFFYISFDNILIFRSIHKEVKENAQYYFSNGNFYQIILNKKPFYFTIYYRDYLYNDIGPKINFETYLDSFEIIQDKIILSIYLSSTYKLKKNEVENLSFSIYSKFILQDNFFLIYFISNDLLNIKFDYYLNKENRIVLSAFKNLNKTSSTAISVSQISSYDSYDFYIPKDSYGLGLNYFIYLNNFRMGMKVILSIADNLINKFYFNTSIFFNF